MPYRRLPNTDNARIRALKTAIDKRRADLGNEVYAVNMPKMELMLKNFEASQIHYKKSLETQVDANKKFQKLAKDARLYLSHFVQVLNMCIIRNEMKLSVKKIYQLPADSFTVPEMTTNDALLEVGAQIINGEQSRLLEGGIPIYNPTIARVNVAYSMFKDAYQAQKQYQSITNRHLEELASQRAALDDILKDLWDQIEKFFEKLPEAERLNRCREYGVVYYYRKGEEEFVDESLENIN